MRRPRAPLSTSHTVFALSAALILGCGDGGGLGFGQAAAGPDGSVAPGSGTDGTGAPSDGDAGSATPSAPDATSPPQGDSGAAPPPVTIGDGATPDAASCTLGSAGVLAFIPGGTMAPGTACVSCHATTGAKKLNVGGTVYPTLHEPDLCIGTSAGVQVVLTDAQGNDHTLSVDSSGNFYDDGLFAFATPYKARVVGATGSVAMISAQTSGDCNSCHSAAGSQSAAGRIIGP